MRSLTGSDIPNIDSSDLANYPYGKFKNDSAPTAADGTELSERTLGDLYQAAIELLRRAGITPSETAEKKADSDIADAIGFLSPVMIIKVGYDGSSAVDVLGGSYKAGYSAEYTTSLQLTGAVATKLTIKKDSVVSTENYYVDVTIANSVDLKAQITAGASHGSDNAFGYFDNDASNIYISANGGGTSDADLEKVNLIIKVFKA